MMFLPPSQGLGWAILQVTPQEFALAVLALGLGVFAFAALMGAAVRERISFPTISGLPWAVLSDPELRALSEEMAARWAKRGLVGAVIAAVCLSPLMLVL